MIFILLKTGWGIARFDFETIKNNVLKLTFANAPANSILSISTDKWVRKMCLNAKGGCEIDVDDLVGQNVSFTVSTRQQVWKCDGIRVTKTDDGAISVMSLVNYAEKLEKLFGLVEKLESSYENAFSRIKTLSEEVEKYKKGYKIV